MTFRLSILRLWFAMGFAALLAGAASLPARAQPKVWKGVVWAAPADVRQAEADLIRMRRAGVEAVRTGLVRDERLLSLADTLGLQLFQELPLDHLPAARLVDTLAFAREALRRTLARARGHPSARHFGLARRSDTSVPEACDFFRALAGMRPDGVRLYYVSVFVAADRCRDAVDFVLLDARDRLPPVADWRGRGLATLGAWVNPDGPRGLRNAHAPEAQARFLETHLNALLDAESPPVAVFVHRWRDAAPDADAGPEPPDPYGRRYGLHDRAGRPRPAFDVTAGIYTGRQRVFAFPPGEAPGPGAPWIVLIGWIVVAMIAGHYARSPRFRFMAPRYFLAHGFYCDAVREGRDVLPMTSALLLLAIAVSVGMTASVVFSAVMDSRAVMPALQWLPGGMRVAVVGLLRQPWLLTLTAGSLYALALATWAGVLAFVARRRRPLAPGQVFMLVVWPRWTLLLLMVAAMVLASRPPSAPVAAALAGAWLLLTLWATVRTLLDFARVTRASSGRTLTAALTHPFLLVVVPACFLATAFFGPWLSFLRHLITRL
ncbi:hypothetical protein [Rhodocaloribacter sp.]